MTTRILLVDDQELLRMGFRMVLEAQDDFAVVGEASNGAEGVALAKALQPDVILMDVRMPELDGVQATQALVSAGCRARIIILTTFDLDEYAHAALRAGASGFLLKDAQPTDLLSAIRAVASGDAVVAPSTTRRLLATIAHQLPAAEPLDLAASTLTPREREVLLAVARGLSNAEIADALVLSEATVKTHVGRILAKLELRDRVQIVIYAYDHGLVPARG
ncbi:response regulator transcription factor [Solirubrobacter ginsenosidimutans]|uniref:Response regulator transcription factor n=1 Tax=Solirubrobacter ginsenosidimutans TaxID=490573 RepID=A0A9X3S043_9ACTN|nr:response regulator transcription factor [Solirubrobacter ginsenosidimutans]MDA0161640.1 response regulator transcription factor [Solirubrobacter ginsenosidimutans]